MYSFLEEIQDLKFFNLLEDDDITMRYATWSGIAGVLYFAADKQKYAMNTAEACNWDRKCLITGLERKPIFLRYGYVFKDSRNVGILPK